MGYVEIWVAFGVSVGRGQGPKIPVEYYSFGFEMRSMCGNALKVPYQAVPIGWFCCQHCVFG